MLPSTLNTGVSSLLNLNYSIKKVVLCSLNTCKDDFLGSLGPDVLKKVVTQHKTKSKAAG